MQEEPYFWMKYGNTESQPILPLGSSGPKPYPGKYPTFARLYIHEKRCCILDGAEGKKVILFGTGLMFRDLDIVCRLYVNFQ